MIYSRECGRHGLHSTCPGCTCGCHDDARATAPT